MDEFWEYKDTIEECDYMYGGITITITDKDIEHLKSGKFINFSVNMEYGCVLKYENEQEKEN